METEYHTIKLDDYHPGEYTTFTPNADLNIICSDPENDPDGDCRSRWEMTGSLNALSAAYRELISKLASPAWDWYGMGGDDHCYDYWPNSMILAADFRDQLMKLDAKYLESDLNTIYWLCRTRYAMTGHLASAESLDDADAYFDHEILDSSRFNPCPTWIKELRKNA